MMRVIIVVVCTFLIPLTCLAQVSVIPQPVAIKTSEGKFLLKDKITVSSSLPAHDWTRLATYFKAEMKKQFNITVTDALKGQKGDIDFFMTRMPTSGKPAYELDVNKDGIRVRSNFDAPTFHAMQTIFQLIPLNGKKEIPFVEIFDHARFEYRGMHLDVSRHFFPVSFIKRYIDYLSYHKLNTFHWHLTDDQGWRIEIKKYPKLTSIGAWRNGTIIGRYPGTGNDNKKYGGFYTQAEVKEVVKYAADRFINVIPEIEMPGHASAAIAAYPELSCFPLKPTEIPANMGSTKSKEEQKAGGKIRRIKLVQESWGVFDDVFCAGKENTFKFLEDVLTEVIPLFPSKYLHVGGDECPKTHWKTCPACQKRMTDNGLKDEHELQSYFIQRMEKFLNKNDKTLIGWDEILEGGLAPNAVVMSWRGEKGGIEAAKQKHKVIMTPGDPVYFDHAQSENEDSVTIGGYNPLEKVYAYEPVPKELNDDESKYIMGAQANLWAEYIKNPKKIEYMLFPRLSALSEVLWSTKENRNWEKFQQKLLVQFKRYDAWKSNYSKSYFNPTTSISPTLDHNGIAWIVDHKYDHPAVIRFDARSKLVERKSKIPPYSNKDIHSVTRYVTVDTIERQVQRSVADADTLIIKRGGLFTSTVYKLKFETPEVVVDYNFPIMTVYQSFYFNKATGKKVSLSNPPNNKYPGDGAFTLVNGVINDRGLTRSKEFLGFSGEDCNAIIDLGVKMDFKQVTVNSLTQLSSWIYPPKFVEFELSDDGIHFKKPENIFSDIEPYMGRKTRLRLLDGNYSARYIKIFIKNYGTIPAGNPGAGNKAWLFVDEIEVE